MKRTEILAPAGSVDSAYAALNAGCDAIYIGGRKYGARAFADNPDDDTLAGIIDDVHFYNRKIYITVNTIFRDSDFKELYDFLSLIYEKGADAVIVQDLGVMDFVHHEFPDMAIHASTQMNIVQASAAELIKNYGVTRIVPARELSFAELSHMRKCTDLEMEVFVHGALCFSYSGQCLMSSLIGGRSGNKGACAQPCRKKYSYTMSKENESHMLSLKDLCSLEHIPMLIGAGIDSFKIEGRMKKPEYVALAVHMYRKYTDIYFKLGHDRYIKSDDIRKELRSDIKALQDIYNRGGFTCGYLTGHTDRADMLSDKRPGHMGVKAAEVSAVFPGKNITEIVFTEKTHPQDILEIRNRSGEAVHVHTLKDSQECGKILGINTGYNTSGIKKGMEVFRIRNNELISDVKKMFPAEKKKLRINGIFTAHEGEKMSLCVRLCDSPDISCTVYGDVAGKAKKHAVTKDVIKDKVKVSGDSLFTWDSLSIESDDDIFINAGALKNLRRAALDKLYGDIVGKYHRDARTKICQTAACKGGKLPDARMEENPTGESPATTGISHAQNREIIAECRSKQQYECVNALDMIDTVYMHIEDIDMDSLRDILSSTAKPLYIVMPRIFREDAQAYFEKEYDMDVIAACPYFKGMVACSLEELAWLISKECAYNMDIRAADNLYAGNVYAADVLLKLGVSVCQPPVEMTKKELLTLAGNDYDIAIYKRNTAMVTAICMKGHDKIYDSYGNIYPVTWHERFGYTEIMHYETMDYIDILTLGAFNRIRLSFYDETPADVRHTAYRLGENLT